MVKRHMLDVQDNTNDFTDFLPMRDMYQKGQNFKTPTISRYGTLVHVLLCMLNVVY